MKIKSGTSYKTKRFFIFLLFLSLCYGFLHGYGFYGFSNDYYHEYSRSNINYNIWNEYGIVLSTLSIYNLHIGVYLTSFFLAFSSGLMLKAFFEEKEIRSLGFFMFIFLIILHTHPIIMSTSGAMRQGWTMIFIFFYIFFFLKQKFFLSFVMITISLFMHKSGLFFFTLYIITTASLYLLKKIKPKVLVLITLSLIVSILMIIYMQINTFSNQRIVSGDFRVAWGLINITYLFYYLYDYKFFSHSKLNKLSLFFYYHSLFAILMVFNNFTYFYERINMIIAIPLILLVLSHFKKNIYYLSISLVMSLYLFLTIYQGMYTIGLT